MSAAIAWRSDAVRRLMRFHPSAYLYPKSVWLVCGFLCGWIKKVTLGFARKTVGFCGDSKNHPISPIAQNIEQNR